METSSDSNPAPPRAVIPAAGVTLLYTALAFLLYLPVWSATRPVIAGRGHDPKMFVWYMAWTPFAVSHLYDPLLTNFVAYPHHVNLMWNTSIVLPSFLLWPVTAAFGPLLSHNLLMMLAPALSGGCAFAALRRFASTLGAAIGGLVYGFSPPLLSQDSIHAQIAIAVFPPLVLLLIHIIVSTSRRRARILAGTALGIVTTAQLLTGTEMLAITAVSATVGMVIAAILQSTRGFGSSPTSRGWSCSSLGFICSDGCGSHFHLAVWTRTNHWASSAYERLRAGSFGNCRPRTLPDAQAAGDGKHLPAFHRKPN